MENLLKDPQIILYLVIGIGTMYNLWLTRKLSNLIFMPSVGVIEINTTNVLIDIKQGHSYKNVSNVVVRFIIRNVGNLPAKNFKINTIGKKDNTILSHEEPKENEGGTIFPQQILINTANINKDLIHDLVENKKRLRYKIEISYSDWKKYQKYNYSSYFEVIVANKNPFVLSFMNSTEVEF